MLTQLLTLILGLGALVLGGAIGFGFGLVQQKAYVKQTSMQRGGTFRSGWSVMPGSMRRVAFLLMALTIVQVACPVFFGTGPAQWLVSGGLVIGYGWTLLKQLRQRIASNI